MPPALCPGRFTITHNYYSEINLHFVWHTKTSLPLLTAEVEPVTQQAPCE